MDVAVVGSVALDTVETPWGRNEDGLGGAATYFSLAAAPYARVHLVGVVGDDFPEGHMALLRDRGVVLDGLERASGKTFRWSGRYHEDVNVRDTLDTQLNVFEQFHPNLSDGARNAPYMFLGNIHPRLQLEVLEQARPKFVGLDTMNLWIQTTRKDLDEVLKRVDAILINDSEVKELTGHASVVQGARAVQALGPRIVLVKKGEHGCLLVTPEDVFAVPAIPLDDVRDPTGAGDSFAGGFMGFIAAQDRSDDGTLRKAAVHGSVVASFTCQAFGTDGLARIGQDDIAERYQAFGRLVRF
ncbi:MAG TPA: PfkB family carbohydrate kinase [Candidatus Hydrogenedentes bacterium]|nr:PfkB family carbohydrate kinase [Candidatus Hydrogenedentota bacterium]HPG68531.1 PfkB family carbohydrate kinase [Candidatus Hydrogenedentota bacterium]